VPFGGNWLGGSQPKVGGKNFVSLSFDGAPDAICQEPNGR